jgi:hypothetical protein
MPKLTDRIRRLENIAKRQDDSLNQLMYAMKLHLPQVFEKWVSIQNTKPCYVIDQGPAKGASIYGCADPLCPQCEGYKNTFLAAGYGLGHSRIVK